MNVWIICLSLFGRCVLVRSVFVGDGLFGKLVCWQITANLYARLGKDGRRATDTNLMTKCHVLCHWIVARWGGDVVALFGKAQRFLAVACAPDTLGKLDELLISRPKPNSELRRLLR